MSMIDNLGIMIIFKINVALSSWAEYTTVMTRIEEVLLLDEVENLSVVECV